jgi:hypothetical protein
MTRVEFAQVLAYLSAGVGKPVAEATAEVYWDLLGDLPLPALQRAAQRALLESAYPTLPTVGTLRELAAAGETLPAAEAWSLIRTAMARHGLTGEVKALACLPPLVAQAAAALGWRNLCDAREAQTVYAQFRDAYEAVVGRDRREHLLPAPLKAELRQIGREPGAHRQLPGGNP